MSDIYTESRIKAVMARNKIGFSKKLGQNFLTDHSVIEQIVEGSELNREDHVIEIGPGIGVLTIACAEKAGLVTAVEIDKKLIPVLRETVEGYDNVEIVNDDILKVDIDRLRREAEESHPELKDLKIIGNLPYYITTPIIMKLLEGGAPAKSITVMMQKEVADRLTASPGGRTYGAISVAVQYYCTIETIAQVPAESFVPKPKVDSTVLRLDLREEKPVKPKDVSVFFSVIKSGFGQRRKTLLNCLTGFDGMAKEDMSLLLQSIGIDPGRRAETLSIEEFAAIADSIVDGR